jgi:hypothetical protein
MSDTPMDVDQPLTPAPVSVAKPNAMAAMMASAKGKAKEDHGRIMSEGDQKMYDAREGLPWYVGVGTS